ncbi:MAG: transposase [Bacteroidales bacterium]|jgi:REP element-mobilizing transposase RayT|nr:transposase [Bacteroidales bacterium]
MSRKYKFHNPDGIYFVSFATIFWVDIFIREDYLWTIAESLQYSRKNKGMEIFAWVILPSHVHLIFRAKNSNPGQLIKELKTYTSKKLQKMIAENPKESRRNWLLWLFRLSGKRNSNVKKGQFWQQNNHPIELWSNKVIDQKIDYIHYNPVKSGFVSEPHHWKYSSAANFYGYPEIFPIDEL